MEMCYDMAFVMPKGYVSMDEEEMMYVDGGIAASEVSSIIQTVSNFWTGSYDVGVKVGKAIFYRGVDTHEKWEKYKWQITAGVTAVIGYYSAACMLGMSNQIHSMFK